MQFSEMCVILFDFFLSYAGFRKIENYKFTERSYYTTVFLFP